MSDQISVGETIDALAHNQEKQIIKITNENPKYRLELGSSPQIWQYIAENIKGELLPLIANVAASPEGNKQAKKAGVPDLLVSKSKSFDMFRPYWSALSNSCQLYPVTLDQTIHQAAVQALPEFPNPILQFANAEAKHGVLGWGPLIEAGLALYTEWYEQELPAVDLFNNLVSTYIDNSQIVPLLGDDNLVLYKVIDAVQNSRSGTVPQDFTFAVFNEFKNLMDRSEELFASKSGRHWPIFLLQMEILTSILENNPEVKHQLTDKGTVRIIVKLLANCKKLLPVYNKLNTAPTELAVEDFPMVKSTAIALLSQVVVQNPKAQDEVRETGGLALVLESCIIDANNPYIKERAVICIRYLLENNNENQKFVASLEAKQVVDPEALEKAGFEANVVDGKITLKGQKPSSSQYQK